MARAIHNANPRGPVRTIDCGSLVGTLMESELFLGHVKGAFSGAVDHKRGLVELRGDGGTTPLRRDRRPASSTCRSSLLRLIQERIPHVRLPAMAQEVDLRIIAATHRNLSAESGRRVASAWTSFCRLNVFAVRAAAPAPAQRRTYPCW